MLILIFVTLICRSLPVKSYSNKLFTITKETSTRNANICYKKELYLKLNNRNLYDFEGSDEDPLETFQDVLYTFIRGEDDAGRENNSDNVSDTPNLLHFPTGRVLRKAELFNYKSGVHLPIVELIQRGYAVLNVTTDYMQTAVDAFAIFITGNVADIERLPADYVLNSARTISMMKISKEKHTVIWKVVRGSQDPINVTYETLEKYRPLFKYLSGKDMAKLNLTDNRILSYIGTNPDLNRHQVGIVASKYIKMNPKWSEARYLNLMNNILCGIPITNMKEILENNFLQLSHQLFYHMRACDPLQRRFYLGMMTRTQALGKAYSWNAQDVSRLGVLLAEVGGEDLGAIKPEALTGLTAQVMNLMSPQNLRHLTDVQLSYIGEKSFNILSKKLKTYTGQNLSAAVKHAPILCIVFLYTVSSVLYKYLSLFILM